jgi:RNA polymerase sigma-70 factor (ECF subfamily)
VVLSEIDRHLLERCLQRKPRAWEDFVDRFMGLIVHVVNHSAQARSTRLTPEDRDDLTAEVFLNIVKDDFAVLRHFRGQASLATYLAVVARRIVVREMLQRKSATPLADGALKPVGSGEPADSRPAPDPSLETREEVERLLDELPENDAHVIRMFHLEGKSYQEISAALGIPENSIGPILTRARSKMRRAAANQPAG